MNDQTLSTYSSNEEGLTVFKELHSQIDSLDVAAEFLSLVLKASFSKAERPVDEDFTAITHCHELLVAQPQLYHAIQQARLEDNLALVTDSPFTPPLISATSRLYLNAFRPRMNIATEGRLLGAWELRKHTKYTSERTLTFLDSLKLYQCSESLPIILHNLGGFLNDDILKDRLSRLFTPTNKFLVNASGTGKTRLCYEGLCYKWGFYFSFHIDDSRLGSLDLHILLPETRNAEYIDGELPQRTEALTITFRAILLARLLVFLSFLEAAAVEEGHIADEMKKRWLILQLVPDSLPEAGKMADIFKDLARMLAAHDSPSLAWNIDVALRKIRTFIGDESLFLVLDEASYAVNMFSHDLEGGSFLQVALQVWGDATEGQCPIICAGIKIPQERFKDGPGSAFAWTSDTGGFNDPLQQEQYVAQFLPPNFRDSPAGRFLIARTWRWLRGRHRFTAMFVEILLYEGIEFPHACLDKYIQHALSFQAADALDLVEAEGKPPRWEKGFYPIKVHRESEENKNLFLQILWRYMATHNVAPLLGGDQVVLMYDDLARFHDTELTEIALDEPIPLLVIARTLFPFPTKPSPGKPNENPATFIRSLRRNIPRTPESLAHCLVFYLTQALGKGKGLDQIFSFSPGPPEWAKQAATLVRFYRTESDEIAWSPVAADDFESFRPLAHHTASVEETLSWLEHRVGTAFCLPHSSNADLVFAIQLADGTFTWVVLKAMVTEEPVQPAELLTILSSLQVGNLFKDADADDTTRSQFQRAFDALPNSGSCEVLRAVCAFPIEIPADSADLHGDFDTAAIVNISALESRSYQAMQTDFFAAIVAGVLAGHKRRSPWESSDENTLQTSRKRMKLKHFHPDEQPYVTWPQAWWDGPIVDDEEEVEAVDEAPVQTKKSATRGKGKKKAEASMKRETKAAPSKAHKLSAEKTIRSRQKMPQRSTATDVSAVPEPHAEGSKNPRPKRKASPVDEPDVTVDFDRTPAHNTRSRAKKNKT
ncbi:hypothetical protein MIND_00889000 [Mycena indigotica]|uniref:Uncharacterized protein n=1 Tax=Mycena indigotica TaxID=2126181 RepID=A0A8H6W4Y8_9AGAR|nr:uncharacterized protein MIND_00889000 [Mycena indigotica]KAF7299394.1 hypothetical protein MIND_00889000 [Mycena indigotica]